MGGKIIKGPLLPRELAEEGRKDRTDQDGLAGAVFADQGDEPRPKGVEVDANFIRKGFSVVRLDFCCAWGDEMMIGTPKEPGTPSRGGSRLRPGVG